jgi:hypothetical protein
MEQHTAALASAIMSGLKPALLDTDPSMQLMGCQLLGAAAARAPALLQQQLVAADASEHLFEVIRGTLSSCSMGASILALQQQQGQVGVAAVQVVTEDLQAAAVSALQCLAAQGELAVAAVHVSTPDHPQRLNRERAWRGEYRSAVTSNVVTLCVTLRTSPCVRFCDMHVSALVCSFNAPERMVCRAPFSDKGIHS